MSVATFFSPQCGVNYAEVAAAGKYGCTFFYLHGILAGSLKSWRASGCASLPYHAITIRNEYVEYDEQRCPGTETSSLYSKVIFFFIFNIKNENTLQL